MKERNNLNSFAFTYYEAVLNERIFANLYLLDMREFINVRSMSIF